MSKSNKSECLSVEVYKLIRIMGLENDVPGVVAAMTAVAGTWIGKIRDPLERQETLAVAIDQLDSVTYEANISALH